MSKARLHVTVHGRVQGVGFRYWVVEQAQRLDLTGWVRNLPGREVEVLAEGERVDLEQLLERLKDGPLMARVTDVDADWSDYRGDFDRFGVTW
ncbi:MAG TPA: acylphosphatase [Armatimonadetes bacterium]|jgi:acylphosphatase|nr:acylphosphatase [Armatimonadota bacterium]